MFRRRGLKISVNSTYASLKRRNIKRHLHFVIIIAYNIQVIGKLSPSMLFAVSNFLQTYRGKQMSLFRTIVSTKNYYYRTYINSTP